MRYYPVFLDLSGQPCVVLGDSELAREKAAGLREAGADVRTVASADYRSGTLAGARLVVDATDDPAINRLTWDECERAGILINVIDRPAQCRFIAPAIVRRDPVVVAISTSGESPFLASALRGRIERWLGPEWGPFTALVGRIRRDLRARGMSIADQTRVYRRLLGSDVRTLLRAGRTEQAEQRAAVLKSLRLGRVALVGAGPGDPELITVRGREMLADADYVLHDALISAQTLAWCGPHTQLEAVGKRGGEDSTSQDEITGRMIELAHAGHFVVRLKGGDPFLFGRGGEELRDLSEAGVDVIVVPGVTSALAAGASIGVPATLRGVASSLAITTARGRPTGRLRKLAAASDTLIVLMARANLRETAAEIAEAVGPSMPAAVVSRATFDDQRSVAGPLADIARLADAAGLSAPATLIVGEVVKAVSARSLADLATG
ncbi:MAG TPA: uroporphyrinogen-III C-methyltransferase [Candidatus Acidoferrum sp.]|nr:uroporphyrinogen-III C-methyltransferase [Candidatus Acidoferrum sp.]